LPSRLIQPFFTSRFLRFAAVGGSGVFVNLGTLALLRMMGVHTNLASAAAIEVSILSNFAINHLWTFGDRRDEGGSLLQHGARFHVVSLGGGVIQFFVFVTMNVCWLLLFGDAADIAAYGAGAESPLMRWGWTPFVKPPRSPALAPPWYGITFSISTGPGRSAARIPRIGRASPPDSSIDPGRGRRAPLEAKP